MAGLGTASYSHVVGWLCFCFSTQELEQLTAINIRHWPLVDNIARVSAHAGTCACTHVHTHIIEHSRKEQRTQGSCLVCLFVESVSRAAQVGLKLATRGE